MSDDGGEPPTVAGSDGSAPRERFIWSRQLHAKFVAVVEALGAKQASPTLIVEAFAATPWPAGSLPPTRLNVKSHLQKYRLHLRNKAQTLRSVESRKLPVGGEMPSCMPCEPGGAAWPPGAPMQHGVSTWAGASFFVPGITTALAMPHGVQCAPGGWVAAHGGGPGYPIGGACSGFTAVPGGLAPQPPGMVSISMHHHLASGGALLPAGAMGACGMPPPAPSCEGAACDDYWCRFGTSPARPQSLQPWTPQGCGVGAPPPTSVAGAYVLPLPVGGPCPWPGADEWGAPPSAMSTKSTALAKGGGVTEAWEQLSFCSRLGKVTRKVRSLFSASGEQTNEWLAMSSSGLVNVRVLDSPWSDDSFK